MINWLLIPMHKLSRTLLCSIVTCCFPGFYAQADDSAVLLKATLITVTGDDNKDHDTAISVTVTSEDGQTTLAHCTKAESSSDDSMEYKDGSEHPVTLSVDAVGVAKSACKDFKGRLHIKTHGGRGHDKWKFNGRVILEFSDKTNITANIGDTTLEAKGTNESPGVDFSSKK